MIKFMLLCAAAVSLAANVTTACKGTLCNSARADP
jgi:hypothetical protein